MTATTTDVNGVAMGDIVDDLQEAEQHEQTEARERAREFSQKEREILDAVQSETCHIELGGRAIEMHLLHGEDDDWFDDLKTAGIDAAQGDVTEEDLRESGVLENLRNANERVLNILDDGCAEDLSRAFWKSLPQVKRFRALTQMQQGGVEVERAGNGRRRG